MARNKTFLHPDFYLLTMGEAESMFYFPH